MIQNTPLMIAEPPRTTSNSPNVAIHLLGFNEFAKANLLYESKTCYRKYFIILVHQLQ